MYTLEKEKKKKTTTNKYTFANTIVFTSNLLIFQLEYYMDISMLCRCITIGRFL